MFIAKCHAYGIEFNSLKYIYDYLTNRKQRVRINNQFSEWKEVRYGVPQGSILGPLFFNIFMCDLFNFTEDYDIINYADDNTPYACAESCEGVITNLKKCTETLFIWIRQNFLKANPEKSHLVLSDKSNRYIDFDTEHIKNATSAKLLGITIDCELKFDVHMKNLCNKASLKLHALSRVSQSMSSNKIKIIMKAFILSQFNYCPLVWMFYSREINNRVNRIHERALRLAYKDYHSSFHNLLRKDGSVTTHHKNLQILVIEIYKVIHGIAPKIMGEIIQIKNSMLNLRKDITFKERNISTVYYGEQSISYLAPRIWKLVPRDIKESPTLQIFKSKIRKWIPEECPCRLCRLYIPNLGFI